MNRLIAGIVIAMIGWMFSPSAAAAPPTLLDISPRGVERSKPTEVTVTGANLTLKAKLFLPFKATQEPVSVSAGTPGQFKVKLTVDAGTPIGVYPVRVFTEEGVSSLLLFSVDPFPNVNEAEDNNTFTQAQKIGIPTIVTGQIVNNDVDHYRFTAKKGQRLVMEVEAGRLGSGVHPYLRLTDANQRFIIAGNDTPGLHRDCRLIVNIPADGDYVLEVHDVAFRANPPPFYRLKIGEYDVVEEVFPLGGRRGESQEFTLRGGTLPTEVKMQHVPHDGAFQRVDWLKIDPLLRPGSLAPLIAVGDAPERIWNKGTANDPRHLDVLPPITINSRLEKKGDKDRFQFPVKPGQRYRIRVEAERFGSLLDGVLNVKDQTGKQIATADDGPLPVLAAGMVPTTIPDPSVDVVVPADATMLTVELRDQRRRGGLNFVYRLKIEPLTPDYQLQQPRAEVNVPRGGSALLTVPITRKEYPGPIQLSIPKLPAGLTVFGGQVSANSNTGVLLLQAIADMPIPQEPFHLSIEGKATIEGQEIRRSAEQKFLLSRDSTVPASILYLSTFAVGVTSAEPIQLRGPPKIELVQGYAANIAVEVNRAKGQETLPIQLTGLVPVATPIPSIFEVPQPPPPIPTVAQEVAVAAGVNAGTLQATAGMTVPEGDHYFVLQGKIKVNGVEHTVIGAPVTLSVIKPFTVELLTPMMKLTAGQTIPVKGRIHRHSAFKDAVQLKLDGLPSGVTALPIRQLAGDWNEFQIDLTVDAKAVASTANATLTVSTTINSLAYSHPPMVVPLSVAATAAK